MQDTTHFTGTAFIEELRGRDGMRQEEARAWIEDKTGFEFHPDAMYGLRWPQHVKSAKWTETEGLRVSIKTDLELERDELEYRKYNKLPPRKPWEKPQLAQCYGRADAAKRIKREPDAS